MTPKEKATWLLDKFFIACHKSSDLELSWKVCKRIALIAVEEIIDNMPYGFYSGLRPAYSISDLEYWQQVKTEIENYEIFTNIIPIRTGCGYEA